MITIIANPNPPGSTGKGQRRASSRLTNALKAALKDVDEVEMRLEDGKVAIQPVTTKAQFKKVLRGCVESSKIDPLEVKRIWNA